ncbi:MAG: metal-sensing transcriptional repressor [Candidatus Jordarchaeales archaeon]
MMKQNQNNKENILKRLKRIEGQIKGIQKMLEKPTTEVKPSPTTPSTPRLRSVSSKMFPAGRGVEELYTQP